MNACSSNAPARRRPPKRSRERQWEWQRRQQKQKQHKQPSRQKCGAVYTWNCKVDDDDDGILEPYAVECGLCEDRPLCRLSEFEEHMEIWHASDWQLEQTVKIAAAEAEKCHAQSMAYNDILPVEWSARSSDMASICSSVESLAPFEQVLIALDAKELETEAEADDLQLMTEDEAEEQSMRKYVANLRRDWDRFEKAEQLEDVDGERRAYLAKVGAVEQTEEEQDEQAVEDDEAVEHDNALVHKAKKAEVDRFEVDNNKKEHAETDEAKEAAKDKADKQNTKSEIEEDDKVMKNTKEHNEIELDEEKTDRGNIFKIKKDVIETHKLEDDKLETAEMEEAEMGDDELEEDTETENLKTERCKRREYNIQHNKIKKDQIEKNKIEIDEIEKDVSEIERSETKKSRNKKFRKAKYKREQHQMEGNKKDLNTKDKHEIENEKTDKSEQERLDKSEMYEIDINKERKHKISKRNNVKSTLSGENCKERTTRSRKLKEKTLKEKQTHDAKGFHVYDANVEQAEDGNERVSMQEAVEAEKQQQVEQDECEIEQQKRFVDEKELEEEKEEKDELESDTDNMQDSQSEQSENDMQHDVDEEDEHENEIMEEVQEEEGCHASVDKQFKDAAPQDLNALNVSQQIEFGLNKPLANSKLTPADTAKLIALYSKHPRLWNQTHPQYNDTQLSRKSWQAIAHKWNHLRRQHQLTTKEVRARISLLCQRYLRERERLSLAGETAEQAKYSHYKQLQFLDAVQPLQNRRQLFEQQNVKILEHYQQFPVLWHSAYRNVRQPAERTEAVRHISTALKLVGMHITPCAVRQRLQALRKVYRMERIQHLRCRLEQRTHDTKFKYYERMQFLDKHIDPYICERCGKSFETVQSYKEHALESSACAVADACEQLQMETAGAELEPEAGMVQKMVLRSAKHIANTEAQQEDFGIVDDISLSSFTLPQHSPITEDNVQIDGIFEHIIEELPYAKSTLSDSAIEMSSETLSHKSGSDANDHRAEFDQELEKILKSLEAPVEQLEKTHNNFDIANMANEAAFVSNLITESDEANVEVSQSNTADLNAVESNLPNELIVKVQCENFSYDLKLDAKALPAVEHTSTTSTKKKKKKSASKRNWEKQPVSYARLSTEHIRSLITLYRQHPQLWNQHHMDYNSRKLRHIAWRSLTTKLNKTLKTRYSMKLLHRKIIDFVKYYKREKERVEQERSCTKWHFYDDFSFMDKVLDPSCQLEKTQQLQRQQLQIIETYKSYPQLWDTQHADYSKRKQRQCQFDDMCQRLQAECQLSITAEKLKLCLIELRSNYRDEKQRRLRALKRQEPHKPSYEFYEALMFLDMHVSPFTCGFCTMSFKKLSDFTQHNRKQHASSKQRNERRHDCSNADSPAAPLAHVCHICGINFTLRNNLLCHLKRHLGEATHACSICPKTFFSSTALRVHERYHNREYPYMCESCGLSYVNASKLNQHMKRHRNQRDYACSKCEKTFYAAFDRDRHERRHLNIRDKVCSVCGKAFYGGSAYYAHMMLHSGVKRFACDECDQRFAQYAGLYKHRKRHHPNTKLQQTEQQ